MKIANVMAIPIVYRAWAAPFAKRKLAPFFAHNELSAMRRMLDVGCGPGTNTRHFVDVDYLGVDMNPSYIESARRRYGRRFEVADLTQYSVAPDERFDMILVNSVFHHIDTPGTARILRHLATLLTDDGHVHILDLIMPAEASISRFLARADRGEHVRPLDEWRTLFTEAFEPVVFEPYPLGAFGLTLWNMVYFKGRARR